MQPLSNDLTQTVQNDRIDHPAPYANAALGQVHLDPAKVLWLGAMLIGGTVGSALTVSLEAIVLFITFTAITLCFGHSVGMHRLFIHRSYRCPKWLEYLLVHLGTLIGLAGPLGTLRTHDTRDWAQRQTQCHDYFAHTQPWYIDAYWQLFCSIKLEQPPTIRLEADIAHDKVYAFMDRTWMLAQLPWAVLFFALGGMSFVFWGICTRVSVSMLGHWLIGYFAHNNGARAWHVTGAAVQGHNIRWTSLLTMGECWHNNHHAFPDSARLGLARGQWDPGWWMLQLLHRVGLATDFVLPTHAFTRPELVALTPNPLPPRATRPVTYNTLAAYLFALELLVCFGPITVLLGVGCMVWVDLLYSSLLARTAYFGFSPVTGLFTLVNAAGLLGLFALFNVLHWIARPKLDVTAPLLVKCGIAAGLIPAILIAGFAELSVSICLGWLPILASLHVLYLGRCYLFSSKIRQFISNRLIA